MTTPTDSKPDSARSTTAHNRELGEEVRRVRKRTGLSTTDFCNDLRWSVSKLSKLENGWHGASEWDIATLLGKCGADKNTHDRLARLTKDQDHGCFVRPHHDGLPDSLLCLLIHEAEAVTISCYEPLLVPPLLQTEQYARAVLTGSAAAQDQLDAIVRKRMDRQETLRGASAPESVFYIHEAALHLTVSNAAVTHDQLMRLHFMCDWTRLSPRVVPLSAGAHPALRHPGTLMTFAEPMTPLAYAETDCATVFLEDETAVEAQREKFRVLDKLALDTRQSQEVFGRWAGAYDRDGAI